MAAGFGFSDLPTSEADALRIANEQIIKNYGSVDNLIKEAKKGNAKAQEEAGMGYYYGYSGFTRDHDKAMGWLEAAVANYAFPGPPPSVVGTLATLYDTKGGSTYKRKAYEQYLRAAEMGEVNAQTNVAEIYRCGLEDVVCEDLNEAFKWYRIAAGEEIDKSTHNDPVVRMVRTVTMICPEPKFRALRLLYKYYLEGDCPEGKPQPTKAVYYLNKAAVMGDQVSQIELGKLYMDGKCRLPRDLRKAVEWLTKAREKTNGQNAEVEKLLGKCTAQMGTLQKPCQTTCSESKAFESWKEAMSIFGNKLKQQGDTHLYVISQPAFVDRINKDFFINVVILIENTIANNPTFFEGLAVLPLLSGERRLNSESSLRDSERIAATENVILLIEKEEPNSPIPCDIPIDCPGKYSGWLTHLYEYLASLYTVHHLFLNGFEAFEKAVTLCPGNHEAKLGMAYCLKNIVTKKEVQDNAKVNDPVFVELKKAADAKLGDPTYRWQEKDRFEDVGAARKKAKELYREYFKEAPKCAKKYPNGYYHLAGLYMTESNIPKFIETYELAQKAEENRLPFLPQVDTDMKDLMMTTYTLVTQAPLQFTRKCQYRGCMKKTKGKDLKRCKACRNVFYCDRSCQLSDWKNHKQHCTSQKGNK